MTFSSSRRKLVGTRYGVALVLLAMAVSLGVGVRPPHAVAGPPQVQPQFESGPNILLIVTDDQRTGTLNVMPDTRYWFNRLGTKFPRAYSTTPQCCPARASLMTGQYSHNHGVENNAETGDLDQNATIQRYLHDAGYRTALFGKFLNSYKGPPLFFDTWAMNNGSHRYYDGRWNEDGTVTTVEEYSTDHIRDRTLAFLQENENDDDRPWYAYVSTLAPHTPAVPESDYVDAPVPPFRPNRAMLETSRRDKPGYVRHSEAELDNAAATRANQLKTLMSVDDLVGEVMTELEALGELENTLAIFMSDNGFLLGEHGMFGPTASKGNPYTASIKIPMSIRWPGFIPEDYADRRPVTNVDVMPTILQAAGIEPDTAYMIDGRSLLEEWSRRMILSEYRHTPKTKTPSWASIRTNNYQYIETYTWGDIGTSTDVYGDPEDQVIQFREYYYLRSDPWQNHNVLADKKEKNDPDVRPLHRALMRARRCRGDACP